VAQEGRPDKTLEIRGINRSRLGGINPKYICGIAAEKYYLFKFRNQSLN
jgi:hypothetical protein